MKPEDPNLDAWMEPELEARMIAQILGEASEFETAELERRMQDKPEMALFQRRLEFVHGLVSEASAQGPNEYWKLPKDQRQSLLNTIRRTASTENRKDSDTRVVSNNHSKRSWLKLSTFAAAAVLMLCAVISTTTMSLSPKSRQAMPMADAVAYVDESARPTAEAATTSDDALHWGFQTIDEIAGTEDKWYAQADTKQDSHAISMSQSLEDLPEIAQLSPDTLSGVTDLSSSLFRKGLSGQQDKDAFGAAAQTWDIDDGIQKAQFGETSDSKLIEKPVFTDLSMASLEGVKGNVDFYEFQSQGRNSGGGVGGGGQGPQAGKELEKSSTMAARGELDFGDDSARPRGIAEAEILRRQARPPINVVREQAAGGEQDGEEAKSLSLLPPQPQTENAPEMSNESLISDRAPGEKRSLQSELTPIEEGDIEVALAKQRDEAEEAEEAMPRTLALAERDRKVDLVEPDSTTAYSNASREYGEEKKQLADLESERALGRLQSAFGGSEPAAAKEEADGLIAEQKDRVEALDQRAKQLAQRYNIDGIQKNPSPADTNVKELLPAINAKPAPQPDLSEKHASQEPFSTFSLHVSDVAFKLAKAALLEKNTMPDPDKVRVEEFVNAFDYGDPAPSLADKVASRTEQAAHPFAQQRNLLRVAMRTAAVGRSSSQALRLTLLLDTSGSMERQDRRDAVRSAMEVLTSQLTPNDSVTLIGFARQARLIQDRLTGEALKSLPDLVQQTPSEGGTNLEEALLLGTEAALRQYQDGGQNRVVLITDGAANLGDAEPETLKELVLALRQQGIAFDACGVGAEGLNDAILEALTRQGDGRYYFLDKPEDADVGFARQLAGALRPAAKNVKVQVRFNPNRVGHYRLMGFEKHLLTKEDFRNDSVDAAEMAAAEAGVALYEVETLPAGAGEIGEVSVRFQDMNSARMVEHSWTIPYQSSVPNLEDAAPSIQLAGAAALLAEKLRGSALGASVRLDELTQILTNLRQCYGPNARVEDLIAMIEKARSF